MSLKKIKKARHIRVRTQDNITKCPIGDGTVAYPDRVLGGLSTLLFQ